jgi:hypothetical protein
MDTQQISSSSDGWEEMITYLMPKLMTIFNFYKKAEKSDLKFGDAGFLRGAKTVFMYFPQNLNISFCFTLVQFKLTNTCHSFMIFDLHSMDSRISTITFS